MAICIIILLIALVVAMWVFFTCHHKKHESFGCPDCGEVCLKKSTGVNSTADWECSACLGQQASCLNEGAKGAYERAFRQEMKNRGEPGY